MEHKQKKETSFTEMLSLNPIKKTKTVALDIMATLTELVQIPTIDLSFILLLLSILSSLS